MIFLLSVFRFSFFYLFYFRKPEDFCTRCLMSTSLENTSGFSSLVGNKNKTKKYLTVWQSESSTLLHDPPHDFSGVNAFLTKPFMQNIILLENVNIQLNCKAVSLQTCIVLAGSGPRNWKPHRARDPQISWPLNTTIKTRHIHNKSQYQTEGKKSLAGV